MRIVSRVQFIQRHREGSVRTSGNFGVQISVCMQLLGSHWILLVGRENLFHLKNEPEITVE